MRTRHDRLKLALALPAIAALTVLAYYPGMSAGFYFDDEQNLLEAVALHWEEFSVSNVSAALRDAHLGSRPVANLSLAVNHLVSALDPAPYHWTNLAIHVAAGLALFWVIRLFQRYHGGGLCDRNIALLAVLLFLVHPLNIQATTYIVQRMTSLSTLFVLLALGSYVSGRCGAGDVSRRGWYLLAAMGFLFAVGSKELGFLLLPLLLLYEACFHGTAWLDGFRRVAQWAGVPLTVVAVAALVLLAGWLGWTYAGGHFHGGETIPSRNFSGVERVLTQGRVQVFYLTLLLWPAPSRLSLDHDFAVSRSLFDPLTTLLAFLFIAATIVFALQSVRTRPLLAFPVLGYWLLHSMESGPVNLELVFEHRMYLPMTMLALLLALNVRPAAAQQAAASYALLLAAALLLAFCTYERNTVWGDPMRFHRDIAQKSPGKFRPQYNLGTHLGERGLYDEAGAALEQAIRIWPESSAAHNQLGNVYVMTARPRQAERHYRQAVQYDPQNAEALFNLASVLMSQGRYEEQREVLGRFVEIAPAYLEEQKQWALRQLGR
jgi:tetratricopeptide (TPR) repeat protein